MVGQYLLMHKHVVLHAFVNQYRDYWTKRLYAQLYGLVVAYNEIRASLIWTLYKEIITLDLHTYTKYRRYLSHGIKAKTYKTICSFNIKRRFQLYSCIFFLKIDETWHSNYNINEYYARKTHVSVELSNPSRFAGALKCHLPPFSRPNELKEASSLSNNAYDVTVDWRRSTVDKYVVPQVYNVQPPYRHTVVNGENHFE